MGGESKKKKKKEIKRKAEAEMNCLRSGHFGHLYSGHIDTGKS